jgi:hypothetical protein
MNLKLIFALLVIAAVPVCAQAQAPNATKVTKADAQNVIKIIRGDKAKTQIYCDIGKLGEEIAQAEQKKDTKKADELYRQMDELGTKLGPEYVALMDGLEELDPNSQDGQEIGSMLEGLDKLCAG